MSTTARIRILGEDQTQAAFKSVDASLSKTAGSVRSFGQTLGVLASGAVLGSAVRRVLDFGDELGHLSTRLGISSQALSEMKYIADSSGVSFNAFTVGLQRQTRRLSEATTTANSASAALQTMGLTLDDVKGLAADEAFELFADRISQIDDQALKVKTAFQLWDSEGVALLQTLDSGSAGIQAMRERARELGLSLREDQVATLQAAKVQWDEVGQSMAGFTNQLVVELAPGLNITATLFQAVIDVVIQTGKAVGGLTAAVVEFISGNFTQAGRIANMVWEDMGNTVQKNSDKLLKAWDDLETGGAGAAAALERMRKSTQAAASSLADEFSPAAEQALKDFEAYLDAEEQALNDIRNDGLQARMRDTADSIRDTGRATQETGEEFGRFARTYIPETISGVDDLRLAYERLNQTPLKPPALDPTDNRLDFSAGSTGLKVPTGGGYWVFGVGQVRTLMKGLQAVRRLSPGEIPPELGGPTGSFASGTSAVPRDMTARLEQGERVISNATTVNISFAGVPSDPMQMVEWVRGALVPEINRELARGSL